jgi:tetratricopeptide (TPR) repeat protein
MAEITEYLKRINAALALREIPDHKAALMQLQKAVKLSPEDATVYLLLGLTNQDLRNRDEAEVNFRKALSLQPDLLEAQQSLGIILVHNHKYLESVSILKPLGDADPSSISIIQALAFAYIQTDNQQEAIRILEAALQFHPNNNFLLEQLAVIFMASKDRKRAAELLDSAIQYAPSSSSLNLRGIITILEQEPEEAIKYFEEAIQRFPDYINGYANLAQVNLQLNRYEKALSTVTEALEKNPGDKDLVLIKARVLFRMARYEEALTFFENLEYNKQNLKQYVVQYYVSLLATGKIENALHAIQKAYELVDSTKRDDFITGVENEGVQLYEQKLINASKNLFEQILALAPESARSINNLGFILLSERNWEAASELFKSAEQQGFEFLSILKANQGYIALNMNKIDSSIALFHEALSHSNDGERALLHVAYPWKGELSSELADDFPSRMTLIKTSILINLATAYFLMNELDKAFSFAHQAIESDVRESAGYRVLGSLYFIEGNMDQARQAWEKSLQSNRSEAEETVINNWIIEIEKHD